MSGDIVAEMTREMNINPASIEAMQHQGGGYPPNGGMGGMGGMGANPTLGVLTPQQQMDMIQEQALAAGRQQQGPPPLQDPTGYESDTVSSSSSSEMDLDKLGLTGRRKTWFDSIISRLKGPLVVIILCILIMLPQVDSTFRSVLPMAFSGSVYRSVIAKAVLIGIAYLGVGIFIED